MPAPLPPFTLPYRKVEAALVRMYEIAPQDMPAFRARFGNLQRAGLLGAHSQPGKGKAVEYGYDAFHRVVLGFELIQSGLAPAVIVRLIKERWDSKLRAIFAEAEHALMHEQDDVLLMLAGISLITDDVPNINHTKMRRLSGRLELALTHDALPARVLIINLTRQLKRFHDALTDVHLKPDE